MTTKYSEQANRLWPYLVKRVERTSIRGNGGGNGGNGGTPAAPAISFFDLTDVDSAGWDNGEVPTWDVTTSTFKPTLPAGGGGGLTYVEGPGIDIAGTLISALAHPTRGIIVDSGGIGVKGKVDGGLRADVDGLYIYQKSHSGLVIDSSGVGVGAGDGIDVEGTLVKVDASDLVGLGIEEDGANNFQVKLANSVPSALAFGSGGGLYVQLQAQSGLVKDTDTGLALGLPSDLSYATVNDVTATSHVHNILSTYDVTTGITSLLNSQSGELRLQTLDLAGDLTFVGGNRSILASDALSLMPDSDLRVDPGGVVAYANSQESRTDQFIDSVTGIIGFQLTDWSTIPLPPGTLGANTMGLKLNYLKVDNLFARKFTADEVRVQRGEWFLTRSFGVVEHDFVVPAVGANVDVWFEEAAGLAAAKLFLPGNWVMFRTIDLSAGLVIQTIYFTVVDAGANDYVQRLPQDGDKVARQQWRLKRMSGGFTGVKVKAGDVGADIGQPRHEETPGSGIWIPDQGVIYATSLFDSDGPFIQTQTFDHVTASVPIFKNRTRMGNLKSVVDYTYETYGFAAGDDLSLLPSAGFSGIAIDKDNGARLFNSDIILYDDNIEMLHMTRASGIAMRNETLAFSDPLRSLAWYDDLDEQSNVPRTIITASVGISGGQVTRTLHLHQNTNEDGSDAAVRIEAHEGATGPQAALLLNSREDLWGGTEGTVFEAFADETHLKNLVVSPAGGHVTNNAILHVSESSSNVNFNAGATIEQQGSGDAVLHWHMHRMDDDVVTTNVWYSAGIDHGSGNVWKLSANHTLGGGSDFFIYNPTTGAVSIPGFDYGTSPAPVDIAAGDGITIASGNTISVNSTIARSGIEIMAGNGLAGGGDLTANRTLSVLAPGGGGLQVSGSGVIINDTLAGAGLDMSLSKVMSISDSVAGIGLAINPTTKVMDVDSSIARSNINIIAGDGLEGGGLLTGNVTLDVDSSVARSTTQILAGFGIDVTGGTLSADSTISVDSDIARSATLMSAGLGILGGGSLAADRSFAIDPSYVVRTTTQVIAGDGLSGGGALSADVTLNVGAGDGILALADTVAVDKADAFDWTGPHSFNQPITISGGIFLIGGDRQITTEGSDILYLRPGGNLEMEPGNNILLEPGGLVQVKNGAEVRSTTQADAVSGITGHRLWWPSASQAQLTITGLKSDSMYTRFFTADEVRINRGEEFWSKSYGIVETDFTLPALFNHRDIYIENVPTISGRVFADGDKIQCRVIDWGTGLTVATLWFTVDSYLGLESANLRQQYRLQVTATGGLPVGFVIPKGTVLLDFGTVGQGMIHLNALRDGGGPWLQFGRMNVAGNTPTFGQHVRVGQLAGTIDYGSMDRWGIVAGNNIGTSPAAGFSGFAADNVDGMRMFNTAFVLYNGGASVMLMEKTNGISIKYGSSAFNSIGWYESLGTAMAPNPTQLRVQLNPKKTAPNWSQFDITSYGRSEDAYTRGVVRLTGQNSVGASYNVWVDNGGVYFGSGTALRSETGGFISDAMTSIASQLTVGTSTIYHPNGVMEVRGGSTAVIRLGRSTHPNHRSDWAVTSTHTQINSFNDNTSSYLPFQIHGQTIIFAIDGTETMRVDDTGNVGIGVVGPTHPLHIYNNNSAIANTGMLIEQAGTGDARLQFTQQTTNWAIGIDASLGDSFSVTPSTNLSSATGLTVATTGRLGLNNTAPGTNLHIGTLTPTLHADPGIWIAPNGTIAGLHLKNSLGQEGGMLLAANSNTYVGNWTNHDLILRTNNLDRMTIDAGGNVGINDTTPTFRLDVNGTLRAVGLVSANAGISFGDETLSTYDEGTFAPLLTVNGSSSGIVQAANVGRYTRVGNRVDIWMYIQLSNKGAGSGTVGLSGLPVASNANQRGVTSCLFTGLGVSVSGVLFMVNAGTTTGTFFYTTSAIAVTTMLGTTITNTTMFEVMFTYFV